MFESDGHDRCVLERRCSAVLQREARMETGPVSGQEGWEEHVKVKKAEC